MRWCINTVVVVMVVRALPSSGKEALRGLRWDGSREDREVVEVRVAVGSLA